MGDALGVEVTLQVSVQPGTRAVTWREHPKALLGAVLALAATVTVATHDHVAGIETDVADLLGRVPWWTAAAGGALLVLTAVHYLLGAVSLRAVSGLRLPLHRTTLVQVAGAATNRIVPGGLGAAGVNVRFLSRNGLSGRAAATRVAALSGLGAAGDALAFALLLTVGPAVGLRGGVAELHALARTGLRFNPARLFHAPLALAVVAALLVVALLVVRRVRARRRTAEPTKPAASGVLRLAKEPRRAVTALVASAGTTTLFALGFAVAVRGFTTTTASTGALMTAYFVAAAVAGATPLPAFVGPTETALTTALVATGTPAVHALPAVLAFRAITFWAPVPVGAWALRRLRRAAHL